MSINLRELAVSVADPSPYVRRMLIGMLRGFGAGKIYEQDNAAALRSLIGRKQIDMLVCDMNLPGGGLDVIKSIRSEQSSEHRTIPIIVMTLDTRHLTIRAAQDAGANMIIAKPFSPKVLYERIFWLSINERPFVETATFFGPDRRTKLEDIPNGIERRVKTQFVLTESPPLEPSLDGASQMPAAPMLQPTQNHSASTVSVP